MDEIYEYLKLNFGMTVAQYGVYLILMNADVSRWPEPGKTELFGKEGLFNRLGVSRDFVIESIAQYVVDHYSKEGISK